MQIVFFFLSKSFAFFLFSGQDLPLLGCTYKINPKKIYIFWNFYTLSWTTFCYKGIKKKNCHLGVKTWKFLNSHFLLSAISLIHHIRSYWLLNQARTTRPSLYIIFWTSWNHTIRAIWDPFTIQIEIEFPTLSRRNGLGLVWALWWRLILQSLTEVWTVKETVTRYTFALTGKKKFWNYMHNNTTD
jgi:hypothetical protein